MPWGQRSQGLTHTHTHRALASAKVFLHKGLPLGGVHQTPHWVVKEGGVAKHLVLLAGHRHRQVGLLSEGQSTQQQQQHKNTLTLRGLVLKHDEDEDEDEDFLSQQVNHIDPSKHGPRRLSHQPLDGGGVDRLAPPQGHCFLPPIGQGQHHHLHCWLAGWRRVSSTVAGDAVRCRLVLQAQIMSVKYEV